MARLTLAGLTVAAASRLYATPAVPAGSGPDYVNAAVAIDGADARPADVLDRLHRIEAAAGRERRRRWEPRTLDLDLLAAGDLVCPDRPTWQAWRDLSGEEQRRRVPGELILPHPRLEERAFVLVPLLDVAPDWRHPVTGRSVAEMAASLPPAERAAVRPL